MLSHDLARRLRKMHQRVTRAEVKVGPLYLEGSFVPTLVGSGTAGTFTYNANATKVEWTRIGNRLYFNGRLAITAIAVAPVGNMSINGWPYPGVADTNMAIAGGCSMDGWIVNIAAGYTFVAGQFANGSSSMALVESGDNVAFGVVQGGEIIATSEFRFFGQYRVA